MRIATAFDGHPASFDDATIARASIAGASSWSTVEIVIPVPATELRLTPHVLRLQAYLAATFPFSAHVSIAAGPGIDCSWIVARELAATFPQITAVEVAANKRGPTLDSLRAQRDCAVLACLDLAGGAEPAGLLPLVIPLLAGACDVTFRPAMTAVTSAAAAVLAALAGEDDWFLDDRMVAVAGRAGLRARQITPVHRSNAG